MRKHKGITFVEVVTASLLISLIAVMMLRGMLFPLSMMLSAKNVTSDAYAMMLEAEEIIMTIREDLAATADESAVSLSDQSVSAKIYTLFSENPWKENYSFTAYTKSINSSLDNDYSMTFVVGHDVIPPLVTPTVVDFKIKLEGATVGLDNEVSAYSFSNARITSTIDIVTPKTITLGTTTYRWYLSEKGYNVDSNKDGSGVIDELLGTLPAYPDKYSIINEAGNTNDTLNLNALKVDCAGRHILAVAVPSSGTSGKMGVPKESYPVFIHGLPWVSAAPLMHFDASVNVSIDTSGTDYKIKNNSEWKDISGNEYTYNSSQPTNIGMEVFGSTSEGFGRYVVINNSGITINKSNSSPAASKMTIFAVVRPKNDVSGVVSDAVLSNGSFSLYLNGASYKRGGDSWTTSPSSVTKGEWYVAAATVDSEKVTFALDDEPSVLTPIKLPLRASVNISMDAFNVGYDSESGIYSDFDLAEIIMYDTVLTGLDYEKIRAYLIEKYGIS